MVILWYYVLLFINMFLLVCDRIMQFLFEKNFRFFVILHISDL